MNIFAIDDDPFLAANLCNKHVVKMPLETAQILCTVAHSKGFSAIYKPTHSKHPAVLWTAKSSANWNWLCMHGIALCKQYSLRYKNTHKCQIIIEEMHNRSKEIWREYSPYNLHTEFAQCMPDKYKKNNPVEAYRAYYIGDKSRFALWKSPSEPPDWFAQSTLTSASSLL